MMLTCEMCDARMDEDAALSTDDGCYHCPPCNARWQAEFAACAHDWVAQTNGIGEPAQYCRKCAGIVANEDFPALFGTPPPAAGKDAAPAGGWPDKRSALLDLASRVERAEGPDRGLDAEIARAIGWWQSTEDPQFWGAPLSREAFLVPPPAFTSSLDAALTLVPDIVAPRTPAGRWPATVDMRRHDDGTASVQVRACDITPDEATDELYAEAQAATPALAICAASLRARALGGG